MAERVGEFAALGTAFLWALTYIQFTLAVRKIGPIVLNRMRLLFALVLLLAAHVVLYGVPIPLEVGWAQVGWLTLSGVVGFAISDTFLFSALLHLGAHRASLVMALVPVTSALFSWGFFGERLSAAQMAAGLVTVIGILLVVSARPGDGTRPVDARLGAGVLLALGAVVSQSLRYILSVEGMKGGVPPLSANLLQIGAAAVAAWGVSLARGTAKKGFDRLRDRSAALPTVGGAVTGPFLGVTLSMVALSRAPVGVASTLMALVPVFLLPTTHFVFKERIGWRAAVGTLLAVAGVAVLFLS
jgi:drug/metabolite transporter (DMT)-like permease